MVDNLPCLKKSKRENLTRSQSSQTKLLTLLKEQNLEKFAEVVENDSNYGLVDLNYYYEYPDHGTLLHIACRYKGYHKFVDILLRHGADVNSPNTKNSSKAAIHFAAKNSDSKTLKILLDHADCNVNSLTLQGNSALHYAVEQNHVNCVKLLLKHPAINVNICNRTELTPLQLALNSTRKQALYELLDHPETDLDSRKDFHGRSYRQIILAKYPEFRQKIYKIPASVSDSVNENLFSLLHKRNIDEFQARVKICKPDSKTHDGKYTYLQYACNHGLVEVVRTLLLAGVDPNQYSPNNTTTPMMIAAERGNYTILKILLHHAMISFQPVAQKSVLHSLFEGMFATKNEPLYENPACDHLKCLEHLLQSEFRTKLDINFADRDGNTPLHYAIKLKNDHIIKSLLSAGAYLGRKNYWGKIPLKNISAYVLEKCLDECVSTNGKHSSDEDYEILFDYSMITHPKESATNTESIRSDLTEMETLLLMNDIAELRKLLKHPVLLSFLNLKWHTIAKYFYINLIFYVMFCLSLTTYICYINDCLGDNTNDPDSTDNSSSVLLSNAKVDENVTQSFDNLSNIDTQSLNKASSETLTQATSPALGICLQYTTLALWLILVLRELYQFYVSPWRYFASLENWLEILLICTTFTLLLYEMKFEQRRQLSSATIMVSWLELMLLIGRHPMSSTNVEMLKTVSCNFLKFLAWYTILILAFAFSFYILFKDNNKPNNPFFKDPILSIIKSLVMLTGEFDAANILLSPFDPKFSVSYLLFIMFVFFVAIVLFNLLSGLAVSDIQAIRADAELVGIVSTMRLISYVEAVAIADPFKGLHFIHTVARYCTLVPFDRARRKRHQHVQIFYENAKLFPYLFLENKVRVLPNERNMVFLKNRDDMPAFSKETTIVRYFCRIDAKILNEAMKVLEKNIRLKSTKDKCIFQKFDEYNSRLENVEKMLIEYSYKVDKSLKQIIDVLQSK